MNNEQLNNILLMLWMNFLFVKIILSKVFKFSMNFLFPGAFNRIIINETISFTWQMFTDNDDLQLIIHHSQFITHPSACHKKKYCF